mgnify:CR=1 FL=1
MIKFLSGNFFWFLEFINCTFNYCIIPALRQKITGCRSEDILNGPDIKRYCQTTAKIFNIKYTLSNPHNIDLTKQFVFISNHSSWFDQPSLKIVPNNPCHFLAKQDYLKIPILNWGLQVHQTIFVNSKSNELANELCQKYLRIGHSLCLYPEATRSLGDKIMPFKIGAFKHSSAANIPLLPIYIENTDKILIKSKPLWQINRGTHVVLHVGQAIDVSKGNENLIREKIEKKYVAFHEALKSTSHGSKFIDW